MPKKTPEFKPGDPAWHTVDGGKHACTFVKRTGLKAQVRYGYKDDDLAPMTVLFSEISKRTEHDYPNITDPRVSNFWDPGPFSKFRPCVKGEKRQWMKCVTCGQVYYKDFVPYSMGNPHTWTPCGHDDEGAKDNHGCLDITAKQARKITTERRKRVVQIRHDLGVSNGARCEAEGPDGKVLPGDTELQGGPREVYWYDLKVGHSVWLWEYHSYPEDGLTECEILRVEAADLSKGRGIGIWFVRKGALDQGFEDGCKLDLVGSYEGASDEWHECVYLNKHHAEAAYNEWIKTQLDKAKREEDTARKRRKELEALCG